MDHQRLPGRRKPAPEPLRRHGMPGYAVVPYRLVLLLIERGAAEQYVPLNLTETALVLLVERRAVRRALQLLLWFGVLDEQPAQAPRARHAYRLLTAPRPVNGGKAA